MSAPSACGAAFEVEVQSFMRFREFLWEHPDFKYGLRIFLIILIGAGFVILAATIVRNIPDPTYSITVVDAQGEIVFEQSGTDKITASISDDAVLVSTKGKTYTFQDASIKEASNTVMIQRPSDHVVVQVGSFIVPLLGCAVVLICIFALLRK